MVMSALPLEVLLYAKAFLAAGDDTMAV